MKLWDKGVELDKLVERFTVGNDPVLDQRLVPYDCHASLSHAKMLEKIGVLTSEELSGLSDGLTKILEAQEAGEFVITMADEDCHTAIENALVESCGDAGKKIHTGRSRNDQVLTAVRLYEKDAVKAIIGLVDMFIDALNTFAGQNGDVAMPGYTHMQRAMPSSFAMWAGAYADSAIDNKLLLESVLKRIDQSPLGTAAGFGVPVLEIDREMTAKELGFAKVQENPIYAQMSRGKFEADIIHVCVLVLFDLNKMATDLIMFSMKEFGFVKLPSGFCTGSSIMPQKKNPDVLELMRAKYHVVLGEEFKVKSMISNLLSGYNRDAQLTKEPVFVSLDTTMECLQVSTLLIGGIEVQPENCKLTDELFATEEANKLVASGVPFRDAYQQVGKRYR